MKKYFWIIILAGITIHLSGQTGNRELRERIFLQTDKQTFLSGELIQMKLVTVNTEGIPIIFSKVAYAELVEDTTGRVQIAIALTNGIGEGIMQLPADLPTGNYRLIAYTQFMRNEGLEVFFEKKLGIVNTFQSGYYPEHPEKQDENENPFRDSNSGNIILHPDKSTYKKREHGELILSGLPEHIHTLSVSVAGMDLILSDKNSVSTWHRYQIPKPAGLSGEFPPEYEGPVITGQIMDNQTEKAVNDIEPLTTGLSFPGDGIRFYTGQNSKDGIVRFFTSGNTGMNNIATIVYNTNDRYRVDILSPFVTRFAPKALPRLYIDSACYYPLLARSVALQATRFLLDDPFEKCSTTNPAFKLQPTNSYLLDEYTRFTSMREVFIEFIKGARFRRNDGKWELSAVVRNDADSYYGTNTLVLMDGAPVSSHDLVYNYDPLLVEQINIYNYPCNFGETVFDGIIEIKTYRSMYQDLNYDRSTQIIPYESPQSFEKIPVPDYAVEKNRNSRTPDSRHTLLWEPDVKTDGKPVIRIPFGTSDLAGEYQITVEGITKDGKIIYASSFFMVEP